MYTFIFTEYDSKHNFSHCKNCTQSCEKMLRVFSDSCLSLDHLETVTRFDLIRHQHILGPGEDFFTQDGKPVQPHPGMEELKRVFSGSTLDLNARMTEVSALSHSATDDEVAMSTHSSSCPSPIPTLSTFLFQQQLLSPFGDAMGGSPCTSPTADKNAFLNRSNSCTVLVLGDNVYMASTVVVKLLTAGYIVRVTVSDPQKLSHYDSKSYSSQPDVTQRLSVLQVDMTDEDKLSFAMKGCQYVIHCGCSNTGPPASFLYDSEHEYFSFLKDRVTHGDPSGRRDSKENSSYFIEYNERAVKALFVAIRKVGASNIKRLVITGAYTSVFDLSDSDPPSGLFDETCWNNKSSPDDDPAVYAKILFEKEAWRLKGIMEVDMVVLLPSVPIGLSCAAETGECMQIIQDLAFTPFPFCPALSWNFVDIQDVAECHLRALELPELNGARVILSTVSLSLVELSGILKKVRPSLSPPTKTLNKILSFFAFLLNVSHFKRRKRLWRSLGARKVLDNSLAKEVLKMEFTPLEKALEECLDRILGSPSSLPVDEHTLLPESNKKGMQINSGKKCSAKRVIRGLSLLGVVAGVTTFLYKKKVI